MQVFKFGGGVLRDPDSIKQMIHILESYLAESHTKGIVVVVSALGKMTNAFEEMCSSWFLGNDYSKSYSDIVNFHSGLAEGLFNDVEFSKEVVRNLFNELDEVLSQKAPENKSLAYDTLVIYGEIISSAIISEYMKFKGLQHEIVDARQIIITDSFYQNARVNWELTEHRIEERISKRKGFTKICLTQGFIGSDLEGNSTTLGREGSDFTAAILASLVNADEVIIWKDVPGIMTGDPDQFSDVQKLDSISYLEAIELSYFGAKILHPNTIKPLQNKSIPLTVKSMFSLKEEGTRVIMDPVLSEEKPVLIVKTNQVLISIQPRDFSFIMEDSVSSLFAFLASHNMRVNLLQHGAVSISICVDYDENRLSRFIGDLIHDYKVLYNQGLDLLTIRHYTDEIIEELIAGRKIYVKQQSRKTARFVLS